MRGKLQFVFWLDVTLLLVVCALETVPFTGLVLHEWLGLAVVLMVVVHLLLSWSWVASSTRKLMAKRAARTRANYILNFVLFALMTGLIFSGILISQEAVPSLLGKPAADLTASFRWDRIHDRFSDLLAICAGLHLAINWTWSVAAARKVLHLGAGRP